MAHAEFNTNLNIMKKLIAISLFLTLILKTNSQEYFSFPDSNAIWNEYSISTNNYSSVKYKSRKGIIGDTILNMKTYSKLYKLIDDTCLNIVNAEYIGGIREEEKKIYILIDYYGQEEVLLYDFSKKVGDTIYSNTSEGYMTMPLTISKIDSINLFDGTTRKRYWFAETASDEYWIEGIGSVSGLLTPIQEQIANFYTSHLSCFKQNDNTVYLNNYSCNKCFCGLYTGQNEYEVPNLNIELIASSTTLTLNINLDSKKIPNYNIQIFNSMGQLAKTMNNIKSNNIEMSIGDFASGIYIINMITNNKMIYSKSFIKR